MIQDQILNNIKTIGLEDRHHSKQFILVAHAGFEISFLEFISQVVVVKRRVTNTGWGVVLYIGRNPNSINSDFF